MGGSCWCGFETKDWNGESCKNVIVLVSLFSKSMVESSPSIIGVEIRCFALVESCVGESRGFCGFAGEKYGE